MLMKYQRLSKDRSRAFLKHFVLIVGCVLVILFAFANGQSALQVKQTDPFSESQAISDARNIFAGKHRFGIVEYCHFPNGPSYMLLPSLALGIDSQAALRLVPLAFSSVCIGVLFLGLSLYASSIIMIPLAIAATVCLLRQPGVLYWMGGLHEQSYALALCFAAMGVSLMPGKRGYGLVILGFVAGWIGYDMLPAFVLSVFTCRLLFNSRMDRSIVTPLRQSMYEAMFAALGALLAVVMHLIQNSFYFGSMSAAFKDLIGSAAARAGVESAATMNNPYWEGLKFHLKDPTIASMTRMDLITAHLGAFLSPEWSDIPSAYVCFSMVFLALVVGTLVTIFFQKRIVRDFQRIGSILVLALCGTTLAGIAWLLIMPHHGRFHFNFLPRHFFVPGVLMWIVVYALLDMVVMAIIKKDKTSTEIE